MSMVSIAKLEIKNSKFEIIVYAILPVFHSFIIFNLTFLID